MTLSRRHLFGLLAAAPLAPLVPGPGIGMTVTRVAAPPRLLAQRYTKLPLITLPAKVSEHLSFNWADYSGDFPGPRPMTKITRD